MFALEVDPDTFDHPFQANPDEEEWMVQSGYKKKGSTNKNRLDSDAVERINQLLEKYAWWNIPDQLESVKQRFLSGELQSGHPEWSSKHIRPVIYLGTNTWPKFAEGDDHCRRSRHDRGYDSEDDGDGDEEWDLSYHSYAFDIIDANGCEYPLLIEYRYDVNPDAPAYIANGELFDRRAMSTLGTIASSDQDRSSLTFDSKAAQVFRTWAMHDAKAMEVYDGPDGSEFYDELTPHATPSAEWIDPWTGASSKDSQSIAANDDGVNASTSSSSATQPTPNPNQPDAPTDEKQKLGVMVHNQLQQIICAANKLVEEMCDPKNATMFRAFQPLAIRQQFAELALKQATSNAPGPASASAVAAASTSSSSSSDTSISGSTSASSAHPLHRDMLNVIASFETIDLPFRPLDPKRFVGTTEPLESATAFVDANGKPFFLRIPW